MKLITQGSTPLRIWLVFFLLGLLLECGILSVLWWMLYLSGRPSPCDYPWIVGGAFLLAVYLASKSTQAELRVRQEHRDSAVRIPGYHSEFGEYIHAPYANRWNASTTLASGCHFKLRGNGSAPTSEQFSTWKLIESNLSRLVSSAQQALFPSSEVADYQLVANEVCFLDNGEFEMSFEGNDQTAELHVYPYAGYSADFTLLFATWGT